MYIGSVNEARIMRLNWLRRVDGCVSCLRVLLAMLFLLMAIEAQPVRAQQSYSLQSVHTSLVVKNQFFSMNDIAVDAQGRIYVLDSPNLKIHVSDMQGTWLFAIDLVVEDRNAGSMMLNTDGTVSVVSGSGFRKYSISGSVLSNVIVGNLDGYFQSAVRLSDGSIAAFGWKRPNVPTIWIFDDTLNLQRSFEVQTAPGYGAGPIVAGLNGNIHYGTGNGTIVEITNTGTFVGSFTVSIPGYSDVFPSDVIALGGGRWLISFYNGFVLEVNGSGNVIRYLVTPETNSGLAISRMKKLDNKLLLSEYWIDQNTIRVVDLDGKQLLRYGKKLHDLTNGLPQLNVIGWDDQTYVSLTNPAYFSYGGLFKIDSAAVIDTS